MSSGHVTVTSAADARMPAGHPFVEHLRRTAEAEAVRHHERWSAADGPLPSLYVSHGAPPLFEDGQWMAELLAWARSMPRPKGVVIVSAHWEQAPASMSSTRAATPLVYDFYGFSSLYYQMQYATPDAGDVGRQLRGVLAGLEAVQETSRGIDHGAWVPLKVMYPEADIPVVQLSLPTHQPDRLLAIGERLGELRDAGILLIGSGFMTHGLRYVDFRRPDVVPSWSADFDAWAAHALAQGDVDELAHYRQRAPGLAYAHPTVEHFTPIFVTLGAASAPGAGIETAIDGYMFGLSKRSFQAN